MARFVQDVNVADFNTQVVERSHEVPVVVDFWATWCGPCRTLGPMLEQAAETAGGAFQLAKVDVDENPGLAAQFGVQGIPTVVGFRNGQLASRFVGAVPQSRLDQWLQDLIPSETDLSIERARDMLLSGDDQAAEEIYQTVLRDDPRHVEAAVGLASILIGSDRAPEAVEVLDQVPRTPEVQRLLAAARLSTKRGDVAGLLAAVEENPQDHRLRMELASAQAAQGDHEAALANWLIVVRDDADLREEARMRMLDVFQVLGPDHTLTVRFRRDLSNALF